MISFTCTSCKQPLQCKDEHAERQVACPRCKVPQTVPAMTQAAPAVAPAPPKPEAVPRQENEEDFSLVEDLPTELPPETQQLGKPLVVCKTSPTALLLGVVVGAAGLLLSMGCGSYLLTTKVKGGLFWIMLALTLGGLVLFGVCIYAVIQAISELREHLVVFSKGIALIKGNHAEICRWEDVDGLFRFVQNTTFTAYGFEVGTRVAQNYTIRRTDGTKFGAGPDHSHVGKFGEIAQAKISPILYPALKQRFAAGETLDCGVFHINQQELCKGKKCLPWTRIASVKLEGLD